MSINKLENFRRTNREQRRDRQTENSKPKATLIPVDSWGERANWTRRRYCKRKRGRVTIICMKIVRK